MPVVSQSNYKNYTKTVIPSFKTLHPNITRHFAKPPEVLNEYENRAEILQGKVVGWRLKR